MKRQLPPKKDIKEECTSKPARSWRVAAVLRIPSNQCPCSKPRPHGAARPPPPSETHGKTGADDERSSCAASAGGVVIEVTKATAAVTAAAQRACMHCVHVCAHMGARRDAHVCFCAMSIKACGVIRCRAPRRLAATAQ
jgi:hypothetical protein